MSLGGTKVVLNAVLHLWASTITSSPRFQTSENNPALSFATFVWSVWGGTSNPCNPPARSLCSWRQKSACHIGLTQQATNQTWQLKCGTRSKLLSEEGDVNLQLLVYFSSSYNPNWTGTRNHPSDEIKYLQLKCLDPRVQQTSGLAHNKEFSSKQFQSIFFTVL